MAYFRCGGGGVPASVKTDMNVVLNKKFGTSTDYPPADWAPTVNLMGPLPEKTQASASVCSFDDGADDVPTKSLIVTIPPTLSGVSVLTETQTEKTIFYPMDIEQGSISGSGYNSNSTTRIRTAERKAVFPSTEYKIKVNSEVQIYEVHEYTDLTGSSTHLTVNASEYTFTTKSTTNYLRILFRYSNNATIRPSAITELQVTDGNFYWKTYTAQLGRTIYGGTADIVNGTGTDNGKKIKLNTLSWSYDDTSYSYGIFLIPSNISDMTGNLKFVCTNYVNNGHPRNQLLDGEIGVFNLSNSNKRLVIRDDSCTTLTQFQTKIADYDLVYESTTETDFTFDGQEIPTRLGYNAFWSDSGDTEVTYRADIDLLLGGN